MNFLNQIWNRITLFLLKSLLLKPNHFMWFSHNLNRIMIWICPWLVCADSAVTMSRWMSASWRCFCPQQTSRSAPYHDWSESSCHENWTKVITCLMSDSCSFCYWVWHFFMGWCHSVSGRDILLGSLHFRQNVSNFVHGDIDTSTLVETLGHIPTNGICRKNPPKLNPILVSCFTNNEIFYFMVNWIVIRARTKI